MTIVPSYWIRESRPTIALTRASDLEHQPDAAFELARAPDGLPLVLHARRAVDVRTPVVRALGASVPREVDDHASGGPASTDTRSEIDRALEELERVARIHSVELRIVRTGDRIYYRTAGSIASHLGPTLLARMLGTVSPMVLPEDVARSPDPARFDATSVGALRDRAGGEPAAATPQATTGHGARMWVGVSRETPPLAAPDDDDGDTLAVARPIVFESLLAVGSARWHVRARNESRVTDGRLADAAAYRRALATAEMLAWSVSRTDAARLVADLARSVDRDWHAQGRVHGDLKPGNVLLEESAVRAFDALDVPEGEISAGMTEGWAAPEQVLARSLTLMTDVFALGLMAAAAVSAAVYGEEQSIIVPAAGDGRRRLRMMKDPEVWLDPQLVELPTEARNAWRALLMQCLAFDPARRPPRGAELANRLHELLDRWEVPGRLEVACGPGWLEHTVGDREPIWLLDDHALAGPLPSPWPLPPPGPLPWRPARK